MLKINPDMSALEVGLEIFAQFKCREDMNLKVN
jgi:hypothetical protein